ncbi:unnamed protein product [Closterium sp. NIES-65]|nr:unnamed protein product [Closterium sp. NIES-65]
MVKPCSNKSNKKGNGNALDKEEINVPDVPVKDLAGTMKSPAGSASAAVLGPFEDLLDLQKNINKDAEEDGKEADENGADAAAPQGLAGEHEAREELGTDDNEQDEVDASPSETPGEEDDGYLSDDSDEHLEPDSLNCVIAFKRFSLTLLVPISRKTEVTRAAVTVAAPLDDWKEHMSPDVLQTTTYQELTPTFFSGTRYGRLQVTFNHVRDAKFVWNQVIRHKCVNGDLIDITWQHPEDARFLRERVLNPTAKEVVIKGVPAEITAELIRRLLVVSKLGLQATPHTVFLGDLNIVADPELDKSLKLGTPAENQRLVQICSRWDLQDAFRCLHPTRKEFTFFSRSAQTSTRIDRVLVSHSLLGSVDEAKHKMVPYGLTDHWFAATVTLKTSAGDHGPGLWRLPAPHVGGEGTRKIVSAVLESHASQPVQGLERLVASLRAGMRAHVTEERKRVRATMKHLELNVEGLRWKVMNSPSDQDAYEELIKNEVALKLYQDSSKERLQAMTGLLAEVAGETPSAFLSGLLKSRKAKTAISELFFKGTARRGAREVLLAASEHFRDAYVDLPLHLISDPWPIDKERRLRDDDRSQLGGEWSEQEVKAALKGLPVGKAPGEDGLPKEFFERNWELLGEAVMSEVRVFERTAKLSESFMTAVTILLHKKGDRDNIGNYRPVTLLSFFYKLVVKVLANRIKLALPRVISENQFGFLPGRSLADAVSLVADAIDAAEEEDEDWLLLLVDFQKAYDSVSRGYLFGTLERMGFPDKFIAWVKGLHEGAATRLLLNGWLEECVDMEKGVLQGCPLAPYLFLCAVEPLCQEITRRKRGVRKRGMKGELAYNGYADDTTLILKGKDQVERAKKLLDEFAEISGMCVNRDKTTLMPLGKNRRRLQPLVTPFKWVDKDKVERLLGIWITSGGSPVPTWDKAFESINAVLSCWETKHLKTTARVTIINSYAMPILLFQAQIYAPPHDVWTKVKRLCHNFISGGKAVLDRHFTLWSYDLGTEGGRTGRY